MLKVFTETLGAAYDVLRFRMSRKKDLKVSVRSAAVVAVRNCPPDSFARSLRNWMACDCAESLESRLKPMV